MNEKKSGTNVSAIDAAIEEAKKRKSNRAEGEGSTASGKAVKDATKKEKAEMSPEDKLAKEQEQAAAKVAKDAERAQRKLASQAKRDADKVVRDQARAMKKAAKDAERAIKKPHTSKLDKARSKLPVLSSRASNAMSFTIELDSSELLAVSQHLEFEARARQTAAALSTKSLEAGQVVRITGGKDTRVIGRLATLAKVQRIRCYADVPGFKKPVYLFTSDVTAVTAEDAQGINVENGTAVNETVAA